MEYGLNPNAIQKLLGHATLDMLSVYAHPSTEFLKEECKKYNFYYEKDRNDTNEKVIPIDFRKKIVYDGVYTRLKNGGNAYKLGFV